MKNPSEIRAILKIFPIKYLHKHLTHLWPKSEIKKITSEIFRYLCVIQRNHKGLPNPRMTKHLPPKL